MSVGRAIGSRHSPGVSVQLWNAHSRAYWPSPTARFIRDGVHLDFGVDDRARFDGGTSQHRIFEVLGEHPIVAAEVARIVEISGDADNIGERRTLFRENSANRLDRTLRLVLDRSGDHIPVWILGDLPGDEDEVTGANGRIERESRCLLSNRIYILLVASRVVHPTNPIRMPRFRCCRRPRFHQRYSSPPDLLC